MAQFEYTLQTVNGDPFVSGGNINITTQIVTGAIFNETSSLISLSTVSATDTLTINGISYTYQYLGSGYVRGDVDQFAAFIRITGPSGAPLSPGTTFAIDLTGQPGDVDYPNLQNGNTQLKVADLSTTTPIFFGVPCFVAGTLIRTARGEVRIEELVAGDHVLTMDDGCQPIRWIGRRRVSRAELAANPKLVPIRIRAGALGDAKPEVDLLVSPQHRMFVRSKIARRLFDTMEVLIPARILTAIDGIDVESEAQGVEYFHILFDSHQIVFANGAPTESLFTGPEALIAMSPEARLEIETLFPEITSPDFLPVAARHIPAKGAQMKTLAQRHMKNNQPLLMDIVGPALAQQPIAPAASFSGGV
jgi:hypothetical protein